MIISCCCKTAVYAMVDYYICERCHQACKTFTSVWMTEDLDNDYNSNAPAIESAAYQA